MGATWEQIFPISVWFKIMFFCSEVQGMILLIEEIWQNLFIKRSAGYFEQSTGLQDVIDGTWLLGWFYFSSSIFCSHTCRNIPVVSSPWRGLCSLPRKLITTILCSPGTCPPSLEISQLSWGLFFVIQKFGGKKNALRRTRITRQHRQAKKWIWWRHFADNRGVCLMVLQPEN